MNLLFVSNLKTPVSANKTGSSPILHQSDSNHGWARRISVVDHLFLRLSESRKLGRLPLLGMQESMC